MIKTLLVHYVIFPSYYSHLFYVVENIVWSRQ